MTEHLKLIRTRLDHLARMREYLAYSLSQVESILQLKVWEALSPDQHESLAAFRLRFSEFQEHLGKTMRSVAMEEEQDVERFGAVLAFMERLRVPTLPSCLSTRTTRCVASSAAPVCSAPIRSASPRQQPISSKQGG